MNARVVSIETRELEQVSPTYGVGVGGVHAHVRTYNAIHMHMYMYTVSSKSVCCVVHEVAQSREGCLHSNMS